MTGIYKWTSPSGKIYIGLATDLQRRKREFLTNPLNYTYTSFNSAIDKARRKYPDFTQWNYEILAICDLGELADLEKYYISLYNSTDSKIGYNSTKGGDGVFNINPTKKRKPKNYISKPNKNGENNPMYGKHHTQAVKDYISSINKGRKQTKEQKLKKSKPVIQYTLDGIMVKQWDSATDAANYYGVNKACIGRVCMGKKKSTCGYKWVFV